MAIVQCRCCGERFDREKTREGEYWVQPSSRQYYHKQCWENKINNITNPKEEAEMDYKDSSYQYLKKVIRMSVDWWKFDTQWKSFLKKGRTPKGIFFTLKYAYEIKKLDSFKAYGGIGIVDFLYEEATTYWRKRYYEDPVKIGKILNQMENLKEEVKVEVKTTNRRPRKKIELIGEDDG